MIIGHIGVAYAAKAQWQRIPLGALLISSFAPDILREAFASAGFPWPRTNLYSHGLPWCLLLAAAAGLLAWKALADRSRVAGVVVAGLVLSHIALDLISGSKDMGPGGPMGLYVESIQQLELAIEGALLLGGWWMMRRAVAPRWATHWGMPVALILLEVTYLAGTMSLRPYRTRCLASPMAECTDQSLLTRKWDTHPFFWADIR
ncbi:MAG: hypothetical protein ABI625_24905 [bacterium]